VLDKIPTNIPRCVVICVQFLATPQASELIIITTILVYEATVRVITPLTRVL
jgi:hypothetical protein